MQEKTDNRAQNRKGGEGGLQVSVPFSSLDVGLPETLETRSENMKSACAIPPAVQNNPHVGTDQTTSVMQFESEQNPPFTRAWQFPRGSIQKDKKKRQARVAKTQPY